jgi:hypothetical protein
LAVAWSACNDGIAAANNAIEGEFDRSADVATVIRADSLAQNSRPAFSAARNPHRRAPASGAPKRSCEIQFNGAGELVDLHQLRQTNMELRHVRYFSKTSRRRAAGLRLSRRVDRANRG